MKYLLLLSTLALTGVAQARLGDTREQAEARYGLPKSEKPLTYESVLLEGARQLTFQYEGWRIRCALLPATDGKEYIVREEYTHSSGGGSIKDFERDAILLGESNGLQWSEQKLGELSLDPMKALQNQFGHMLKGKTWARSDGATAVHGLGGSPLRLQLPQAVKYEAELKAIRDAEARKNMPKF